MHHVVAEWLVHLADPLGPRTEPPGRPLEAAELEALVEQAELHGVLASVLANVTIPPGRESEAARARAVSRHQSAVGHNLVLRQQARRVMSEAAGLEVILVKGPVMAEHLYPDPRLRRFTDLDLLAAQEALTPLARLLTRLGYRPQEEPTPNTPEEWKWFHRDRPEIMIEVQTNLIHSKSLQAGLWLRYADVVRGGSPAEAEEPAALLAIASIHGAGHQFERLLHVVDVLQAARQMSASQEEGLERLLERTGARLAAVTGLDLAGRLFGDVKCVALAKALGPVRGASLARRLLGHRVVTSTMTDRRPLYAWRRALYRELLKARSWFGVRFRPSPSTRTGAIDLL